MIDITIDPAVWINSSKIVSRKWINYVCPKVDPGFDTSGSVVI